MSNRDRIDVTCPCGASLTVEASAQTCVDRLNDWTKDHKSHRAPAPTVVYRDRWYPTTTPYYNPYGITTSIQTNGEFSGGGNSSTPRVTIGGSGGAGSDVHRGRAEASFTRKDAL